jgi:hypothetical protein
MIPLERFLNRYGLGEECPDDRYFHYVSRRIIMSKNIKTTDDNFSEVAAFVLSEFHWGILETGCNPCDS